MTPAALRHRALALQAQLDALDDAPWPSHLQAVVDRCRNDLAVILAATDAEMAALLEGAGIESFEALRGLLRRQQIASSALLDCDSAFSPGRGIPNPSKIRPPVARPGRTKASRNRRLAK